MSPGYNPVRGKDEAQLAYTAFSLSQVIDQFHLDLDEKSDLYSLVPETCVRPEFVAQLDELTPLALAIATEKARSELIIAPVLVEAKKEDMHSGYGQCLAEMVAAQMFNDREGTPRIYTYGVVTNGTTWRFSLSGCR